MKTLVVVGHPHLDKSVVSRAWMEGLKGLEGDTLRVHVLTESVGADGSFDVAEEKKLLTWADRVVLQFPLYWMGMPGLMKSWMDEVWDPSRSSGGPGTLEGKRIDIAVSIGAPSDSMLGEGGLEALLVPLVGSFDFAGARRGDLFTLYGTGSEDAPERLAKSVEAYRHFCSE